MINSTYKQTSMQSFFSFFILHPISTLSFALLIVVLYALYLDRKIYTLTRGHAGMSLEEIIKSCVESVEKIEKRNELISKHSLSLDERVSHSLRNIQTLRYKAYDANGSNQSFSLALLNEKGNGVIISSLHSRSQMSTFAKPVVNYVSTYELTEEEVAVILEAKKEHRLIGEIK